jgi:hypothetical protein
MGLFSRTVTIKADRRLIKSIEDAKGNLSVERLRETIRYEENAVSGMSSETRSSDYGRNHLSILSDARTLLEQCQAAWAKDYKVKLLGK